jgi:hypothetical protein
MGRILRPTHLVGDPPWETGIEPRRRDMSDYRACRARQDSNPRRAAGSASDVGCCLRHFGETYQLTDRRARRIPTRKHEMSDSIRKHKMANRDNSWSARQRGGPSTEELVEMRGLEPSFGRRVRQ